MALWLVWRSCELPKIDDSIVPFRVAVRDSETADLTRRLNDSRIPPVVDKSEWLYGTDSKFLTELGNYWREEFDWKRAESLLNRWPQWRTDIDGESIHFIHHRSPHDRSIPLLLLHGWPSSPFEFHKIIDPLTSFDGGISFHVVVPSLPGFAWSGPTQSPGWDVRRMARAFVHLMHRLGYSQFVVHGDDWGSLIATEIALVVPESTLGIHLDYVLVRPPVDPHLGVTSEEQQALDDGALWGVEEFGYDAIQSTKPHSLGVALNDSPLGLAAWIVEKFRAWSDCGGDIESRFTKDELLTTISTYWFTQTITSSMRLYAESARMSPRAASDGLRVSVPTAVARFPKEIFRPPRSWVESRYNVQRWSLKPAGGHFPAMEEPTLLVSDIRQFVVDLI